MHLISILLLIFLFPFITVLLIFSTKTHIRFISLAVFLFWFSMCILHKENLNEGYDLYRYLDATSNFKSVSFSNFIEYYITGFYTSIGNRDIIVPFILFLSQSDWIVYIGISEPVVFSVIPFVLLVVISNSIYRTYRDISSVVFFVLFFSFLFPSDINAMRFYYGILFFCAGFLKVVEGRKKDYITIVYLAFSGLSHFAFIPLLLISILVILLNKSSRIFIDIICRKSIYIIIISFCLGEILFPIIQSYGSSLLDKGVIFSSFVYVDSEYVEFINSKISLVGRIEELAPKIFVIFMLWLIYKYKNNFFTEERKLAISLTVLLTSFSLLLSSFPTLSRYIEVSAVSLVLMFGFQFSKITTSERIILASIVLVLVTFNLRVMFELTNTSFFMPSPLFYLYDDISVFSLF